MSPTPKSFEILREVFNSVAERGMRKTLPGDSLIRSNLEEERLYLMVAMGGNAALPTYTVPLFALFVYLFGTKD